MRLPTMQSLRNIGRRLRLASSAPLLDPNGKGLVEFVCNLCNAAKRVAPALLSRETPSCATCGSTVRFRSIAHLVVKELLGIECALARLRTHAGRRFVGLGLSDAPAYAKPFAEWFDYTNTYLHKEPRLDITDVPDALAGRHDFVVASDVFEHVAPPVSRAFRGARRLLRPGGVLILTVPFSLDPDTVEHFPELHEFSIVEVDGTRRLHNRTRDGRMQTFDQLVFHGGDGTTLEMRLFSRAALERELREAGFSRVRFADEACARFGIVWPQPWSVPVVARP